MPEQNKVNILGIDVSFPEVEEAVEASVRLVREPGPGLIYFLTAESSLLCQNDAQAAAFVNRCDLVLPGDLHTQKAYHRLNEESEGLEGEGPYAGNYMTRLFSVMNEHDFSIYAVMDSEETLTALQEYILTEYPGINLDGILVEKDTEGEFGRVVNDINACVPDIVFLCLPPEWQIQFADRFSSMMNTGLCVCIESMQPWIHKETVEVPGFFRAIGASGLYFWLKKKGKFHQLITGSIFRKQVLSDSTDPGAVATTEEATEEEAAEEKIPAEGKEEGEEILPDEDGKQEADGQIS